MLTHTVFFWLKPETTSERRALFEADLRVLLSIPGSTRAVIGKASSTEQRPVVDHSYDYALELDFASVADHDLYQDAPAHHEFIAKSREIWEKVQVYDFDHLG